MKVLGIYGGGATGRMLYDQVSVDQRILDEYSKIIFVNDTNEVSSVYGIDCFSFEDTIAQCTPEEIRFLITVGDPAAREKLWVKIKKAGYSFATWVHRNAFISPSAAIGEGCMIDEYAAVDSCSILRPNTYVYRQASIGHDSIIGNNCMIGVSAFIGGHTIIEKNVFYGAGASCRDGVTIGHDSIVGINSAVYKDVPSEHSAIGNPARNMHRSDRKMFK